jgi:hypothetical protein
MCDLTSCTVDELRARLTRSISDRLDAHGVGERARAGDDLLDVLDELAQRGVAPLPLPDARPDGPVVPRPHVGRGRVAELVLVAGSGAAAAAEPFRSEA